MRAAKNSRRHRAGQSLASWSIPRIAAAAALTAAGPVFGLPLAYIGADTDNWKNTNNWNTLTLPGSGDTASIGAFSPARTGQAVTVTFNATNLAVNGLAALTIDSVNCLSADLVLNGSGGTLMASQETIGNTVFYNQVDHSAGINTTGTLYIGNAGGSSGLYNLSGTGVLNATDVRVGNLGLGQFNQSGGTFNVVNNLVIGEEGSSFYTMSAGDLNVTNTNSSGGSIELGFNGTGTMTQSGGIVNCTALYFGKNSGAKGYYNLTGTGTLNAGIEYFGFDGTGTLTQSGGQNNISNGPLNMAIGATYILSGAGSLNVTSGEIWIGQSATSPSAFNQSAGTVTLNSSTLETGVSGLGSYNFSGGNLDLNNSVEYIGDYGTGTFNQTSGTHFLNFNSTLYMGYMSGSSGTYNLHGGSLDLTIGSEYVGVDGTAMFNQSGGNNYVSNFSSALVIGSGSGSGTYLMKAGNLTVNAINIATATGTGAFNQTGGVTVTGPVTVGSTNGGTGSVSVLGPAVMNISGGVKVLAGSTFTINSGGIVNLLPHAASYTADAIASFSIAPTGQLDLSNNALDLPGASLSTLVAQVRQGYNNGNWNGPGGIVSSAAAGDTAHLTTVGVIQNNQSGTALFTASKQFEGVTPGAGDILVKFTYYGDTNLDGKVDGSDYSRLDSAYLADKNNPTFLTGWFNGDFNYDGAIDGSDFALIDNAYNTQGTQLTAAVNTAQIAGASSPVPEPAATSLLVAAAGTLRRRRHPNK